MSNTGNEEAQNEAPSPSQNEPPAFDADHQMIINRYDPSLNLIPTTMSCWERDIVKETATEETLNKIEELGLNYCNYLNPENIQKLKEIIGEEKAKELNIDNYEAKLGDYSCQLQTTRDCSSCPLKCVPQPYSPPTGTPVWVWITIVALGFLLLLMMAYNFSPRGGSASYI